MTSGVSARLLEGKIEGRVLTWDDDEYDDARAVWNAMVDRRPRMIVRCATPDDVATAIRYARDGDLEIGVRCGGHGVLGAAVPEDGLMIDLTPMGGVRVDPRRRRAWVEGGALLGALDQATQPHGLATTAGNVSHTGVGGLTLGGGMGWLARQFGLSCDNVASFEVVTAEGNMVRASAAENAELYWGLRGGGGNFGVVTEFEFQLHPMVGEALVVDLWFALDEAPAVLRGWRDLNAVAPRAATFTAWVGDMEGRPMASVGYVWIGDVEEGRRLLPPLRALGKPVMERVHETSYVELQRMDDSVEGHTFRRYWKGHYVRSLPDEAIEAFLLRGTPDGHGPYLPAASLQAYGGAIADVPDEDTAFSHRDTLFEFVSATRWSDPTEDELRIGAARRYAGSLDRFASGAYVNVLTDEGQAGVRRAYPPEKLARLTALKDTWDPQNVFHLNHNIPPTGRPG
ncbi:FAD-binding oxidoreductase [Phytoactinopolyspora alkaliphila]|uniref:FAD-binding oxidoreductase n=1 Tax=Phytoactinopolyspora alkaliphila TaxID=1783498 RepID=A0A6N9YMF3_9ACTN|nr:FAD-binding oxidoreductase [Phytoactinopolyspora alkaliphila]NED96241.1 FAD-binding oxidoreductase [Phytoactinopolyspora alkaliphila]